ARATLADDVCLVFIGGGKQACESHAGALGADAQRREIGLDPSHGAGAVHASMLRPAGKRPVSSILGLLSNAMISPSGVGLSSPGTTRRDSSMIRSAVLVLTGSLLVASASFAQGPPLPLPLPFPNFQGTPEEQRACRPDVVKLCKDYLGQNDNTVVLRCL